MKIIVDAFGGDNAPLAMIEGSLQAHREYGVQILLVGERDKIEQCAKEHNLPLDGIEILEAQGMIPVEADPTTLLKEYADSSMAVGMQALKDGKGDAFVSAGSTGALVVGASLIVKRLKGVRRTAIPTIIPSEKGCFMLIDSGANAECNSDMLLQFGLMGSVYMQKIMGMSSPRVGLINIGTEERKGLEVHRETYHKLQNAPVNFIGNVEARGLPLGECDVAVCDGFTGNVILKLTEGVAKMLLGMLKGMFLKNLGGKLAYLLLKGSVADLKHQMDSEEYGGAPFLGAKQPVIKAHGSSKAKGIKNAIRQAKICVENDLCGTMQSALDELAAAQKTEE